MINKIVEELKQEGWEFFTIPRSHPHANHEWEELNFRSPRMLSSAVYNSSFSKDEFYKKEAEIWSFNELQKNKSQYTRLILDYLFDAYASNKPIPSPNETIILSSQTNLWLLINESALDPSKKWIIFKNKTDALKKFEELGGELLLNASEKTGLANIYKCGEVDLTLIPLNIKQ